MTEYKQELKEIEALPTTYCSRATPEFLRVTAMQKLMDATVAWGCKWLPFGQAFHNLLESEFVDALKHGTVDMAWMLFPFGKVAKTALKPVEAVAKPVIQAFEKQAQRFGAKVVHSKELEGLFKEPNVRVRGALYEDYLSEFTTGRLQKGHKGFDFFDPVTGKAINAKTLDTLTPSKLASPKQSYYTLKKYVDKMTSYRPRTKFELDPARIVSKELDVAIPLETPKIILDQISRAQVYGSNKGVEIVIRALGQLK